MPTLQAQAVRKAIQVAGGDLALAAKLGITVTKLNLMAEGLARVPDEIFMAVADLLAKNSLDAVRQAQNPPVSDAPPSSGDAPKKD